MIKLHSTLINDSGSNLTERTELNNILEFIHKGEYLVVTHIDRLACSLKDLQIIADCLKAQGANLSMP